MRRIGCLRRELLHQRHVLSHRHLFGTALQIKAAAVAVFLQPTPQAVAQQLAPLAEGHLHHGLQQRRITGAGCAHGTMRTTALSTRGGGSKLCGGTNNTFSMA